MKNRIKDQYFTWIYDMVCGDHRYKGLSYKKLLRYLYQVPFTYTMRLDENRAVDGVDLRYQFGYRCGYPNQVISRYLDDRSCSTLEMIVALAFKIEESIVDDDTTGQWFWNMIVSLGLNHMSDRNFNEQYVRKVIDIFLNRSYDYNGAGGLFTLEHPPCDLRDEEIWNQAMWYLNEILEDQKG